MAVQELPSDAGDQVTPEPRQPIPLPGFFQTAAGRLVVAVVSAAVLMPIVATSGRWNHAELVQPIGLGIEGLAIVVGIVVGVVLAEAWTVAWRQGHMKFLSRLALGSGYTRTGHWVRSDDRASRGLTGWLLTLVLAIGAVLTATQLAREAVMWRAFAGVTTVAVPEPFTIVDKIHDGKRTFAHLRLRLGSGGRTFSFRTSPNVFVAARKGGTLLLPVETGRGGVQRMVPPSVDVGPGELRPVASPDRPFPAP